jgi:general secretion pathway protein K
MNADKCRLYTGGRRPDTRVDLHSLTGRRKEGSALIIVLAVVTVLALIVADFAAEMNSELKAAAGHNEEAVNFQLARSALALARLEVDNQEARLYANGYGDAYLITGTEDYEEAIEELQVYRDGYELGRGKLAYRLVHTPSALDPNELGQNDWHRLLEVACGMDEGEERSELVDCIIDWIDNDDIARASGMEEDDYQQLSPPRHVKNGALDSAEELMLVYGITPELFYGYDYAARIEDGMVWGGGLLRYLIGDNSPEGRASAQYILQGVYPEDDERDEEEELEYRQVEALPEQLYLIAQGYMEEPSQEDETIPYEEEILEEPAYISRRIILVRLKLGTGQNAGYELDSMFENASRELLDRILSYGVPEEDNML